MTILHDPTFQKKLILTKQLYQNANYHLVKASEMGKIMAAIMFDLSIETLLKLAIRTIDSVKQPKSDVSELIQQIDSILTAKGMNTVPAKGNVLRVRSIRNAAQHEARTPNTTELTECHIYTRDFLRDFVSQLWGIDFDSIRLSSIIQTPSVKTIIEQAEFAFDVQDYVESTTKASGGLAWILHLAEQKILAKQYYATFRSNQLYPNMRGTPVFPVGQEGHLWRMIFDLYRENSERVDELERELEKTSEIFHKELKDVKDMLVMNALGIDRIDFLRMSQISGHVDLVLDNPGNPDISNMKSPLTADEAEYVLSYCSDAVIKVETQLGNVDI